VNVKLYVKQNISINRYKQTIQTYKGIDVINCDWNETKHRYQIGSDEMRRYEMREEQSGVGGQ